MRRLSLALALMSLLALPAQAANFSAKDAAAATIIFTNPGNCTTGCTPIFSWADSTGVNLVAVLTAGADAASNTANGGIVYNRNMVFNGTTWDRWQGAISIASGKVASGAFASGSIASGAVASGAYAAGSIASGAMVDLGAQADAVCGSSTGSCSLVALIKFLNTAATAATPAGEFHIGEVASNQIKVQVAQTVTSASAYASGNAVGGLMTIAGAARVSGSLGAAGTGGILTGLMMNSKSLQTTQVDVFLFDANPTTSTCTDKTAFSLATADFDKVIGVVTIPGTAANGAGWYAGTVGSTGVATYYPVTYDLASSTSMFACAVTRGTPTYTATTDVSFKFNILRN